MPTTEASFAALFEGRKDAYGLEEGGCAWFRSFGPHAQEQMWQVKVNEHLGGTIPFGVYPLRWSDSVNGYAVKWGCSDLDNDNLDDALNLHTALDALHITGWIERSRSQGYHVWVFAEEWINAETMRNALLVAHQLAGVRAKEVNPKQTDTAHLAKKIGNYVRLPYPGGLKDGEYDHKKWAPRQVALIDPLGNWPRPLSLTEFLSHAHVGRVGPHGTPANHALIEAAKLYVPPVRPTFEPPKHRNTGPFERLNRLGTHIFHHGPRDGDRSQSLAALTYACKESDLTPYEALNVVAEADSIWGKFSTRPDGAEQLQRLIERVYGG